MLRSWRAEGNKVKKEATAEVQWSQVERRGHFEKYLEGRILSTWLLMKQKNRGKERERERQRERERRSRMTCRFWKSNIPVTRNLAENCVGPSPCAVLHACSPTVRPPHPPSPGRAALPWRAQQGALCTLLGMVVLVHSNYWSHSAKGL